jgi:hypothetical protein
MARTHLSYVPRLRKIGVRVADPPREVSRFVMDVHVVHVVYLAPLPLQLDQSSQPWSKGGPKLLRVALPSDLLEVNTMVALVF